MGSISACSLGSVALRACMDCCSLEGPFVEDLGATVCAACFGAGEADEDGEPDLPNPEYTRNDITEPTNCPSYYKLRHYNP